MLRPMADPDRDTMLRDMAANRGCRLVKSRRRTPGVGDYGLYGLKDAASGKDVFGVGDDGLTATPEEIEAYLRRGLVADWKSSLAVEDEQLVDWQGSEETSTAAEEYRKR